MPKVYSHTVRLDVDELDAYCCLAQTFHDQFVYYDKQSCNRRMGLGRCVAVPSLRDVETVIQGPQEQPPVFFSFNRFDAFNPASADDCMASFPQLLYMLPELVVLRSEEGVFLQVNSLGPIFRQRVARFAEQAQAARPLQERTIAYTLEQGSFEEWEQQVDGALGAIRAGRVDKVVLSRRAQLTADEEFTSQDVLVNFVKGPAKGVVYLYRYDFVFFCGCTPELLVRKRGDNIETMCLAGTIPAPADAAERERLGCELLNDPKNRTEHQYVVDYVRHVADRLCYDVQIPREPRLQVLPQLQHLMTPVAAKVMPGKSISEMANQLAPTPALSGSPVGEACMLLRQLEPYNRGFFGGTVGYIDGNGDGEFSVAIRCGVFDGRGGYVYAGCGIVEGSDAKSEYQETGLKMGTALLAFGPQGTGR